MPRFKRRKLVQQGPAEVRIQKLIQYQMRKRLRSPEIVAERFRMIPDSRGYEARQIGLRRMSSGE
jgi:hypothetical protein